MSGAFGARLAAAVAARGPLVVGIDPHRELLAAWGLPDDVSGLERFAMSTVDAVAGELAMVKPQSAFFERFGAAGIAVLERAVRAARAAGALVLLDAKRGDMASTVAAYAQAYLAAGAPLAVDALTASPYLGYGALAPLVATAREHGTGVFVLARTSNPEGGGVQQALAADGRTVAQAVAAAAAADNAGAVPAGPVGLVVGATLAETGLDLTGLNGPVLAPGYGAQGGTAADLARLFPGVDLLLPATSRAVLSAGPDPAGLRAAVRRCRDDLAAHGITAG